MCYRESDREILTYPDPTPPCLKNVATKARGKAVRVWRVEGGIGGVEDYGKEVTKKKRTAES